MPQKLSNIIFIWIKGVTNMHLNCIFPFLFLYCFLSGFGSHVMGKSSINILVGGGILCLNFYNYSCSPIPTRVQNPSGGLNCKSQITDCLFLFPGFYFHTIFYSHTEILLHDLHYQSQLSSTFLYGKQDYTCYDRWWHPKFIGLDGLTQEMYDWRC